jgi:hypothetical protein
MGFLVAFKAADGSAHGVGKLLPPRRATENPVSLTASDDFA